MATKKTVMLMTRSVVSNPCLHREACIHAVEIAAAEEIETQLVSPDDVDRLRAGGTFVDQASCLDPEE